jgi:hypothetical protein
LNPIQREKLLEFINTITRTDADPSNILKILNFMDSGSINEIEEAINNDCERIDFNEW